MADLHVCEVIKSLDLGGAEMLLTERLRLAPRDGLRYTVVCMRAATTELIDVLTEAGTDVVDLSDRPEALRLPALVSTVARLRPDVVNAHSPLPASLLRPCLRLTRRRPKLVTTVHSVEYARATMLVDRLTMPLDDTTVAVSPVVAAALTTKAARNLTTRIHGVDVRRQRGFAAGAAAVRAEFGVPPSAFLVACVANLRPVKNHQLLVAAAALVARRRPDMLFLLAGDGPLRAGIAGAIEHAGVGQTVRLLGRVPQAGRLLAAADLAVLSSRWEGLPVSLMEALAAGVPVVAPAVGGIGDLVCSGHNGLLVRPGSPEALADAIVDAASEPTRQRLRAGAARTADRVDLAATAAWFERLYAGLAGAVA